MKHSIETCERIGYHEKLGVPVWRCPECGARIAGERIAGECRDASAPDDRSERKPERPRRAVRKRGQPVTLGDYPCPSRGSVRTATVSLCGTCSREVEVCACLEFGGEATLTGVKVGGARTRECLRCEVRLADEN